METQTVKVKLKDRAYDVLIGTDLLREVGERLRNLGFSSRAVVITNPTVNTLHGIKLSTGLEAAGLETFILEVPDGEKYKSLEQAGCLYEQLAEIQVERQTPILALGGGVIGDLAGFVAATYMRGVPLIQIPTTLLAQVDSSLGGKVAVNHKNLKNNIGAFYQPRLVVSDIDTLNTLPGEEFQNGLAEVVKYGLIWDREIFDLIARSTPPWTGLNIIIHRCVTIKAEIVAKDETDLGLRNILNFGHTLGHALETVSNYDIKHGQGVALGMVAASRISYRMGTLSARDLEQIITGIDSSGLPVKMPDFPGEKVLAAMQHDKKKADGRIRFILPRTIGEVFISDDVSLDLIDQVLKEMK